MTIRVAELFAGVGGFRLGLEGTPPSYEGKPLPPAGDFTTVWANQWEPPGTQSKQFAWRCYEERFGTESCVNADIHELLTQMETGVAPTPEIDMVVGGFPCQDYSVAKPLSQSAGIEGKKGVLWWDIYRFLHLTQPRYVVLENVDRLLSSPATRRGRDFGIILSCLYRLGFNIEWRIVNSAEYGFPQRRKRTFIVAERATTTEENPAEGNILGDAFPAKYGEPNSFTIPNDPYEVTTTFPQHPRSPFRAAGTMINGTVTTFDVSEIYDGKQETLGSVLTDEEDIPDEFFIDHDTLPKWGYAKGAKDEQRTNKTTGATYRYKEGAMAFPDPTDRPARTILTSEGGASVSRTKHVIETPNGLLRRLTPDELDALQGFPPGWTDTSMTPNQRAFCMGNALVVGVVHRIGQRIAHREAASPSRDYQLALY